MNAILSMALKDARILTRDRAGLFFVIGFPFLYAILLGTVFSDSGNRGAMDIVVVDEDATGGSRAFIEALKDNKGLMIEIATLDEARTAVRTRKAVAYIVLPKGFEAARKNLFLESPVLEIGADPGRQMETGMLQGMLMRSAFAAMPDPGGDASIGAEAAKEGMEHLKNTAPTPEEGQARTARFLRALGDLRALSEVSSGAAAGGLGTPIRLEQTSITAERRGPKNSFEFSFPQGIVWAALFCITRFSSSLVTERKQGTLIRMQMAPVTKFQILAAKALVCFVVIVVVSVALIFFGMGVYGIRAVSLGHIAAGIAVTAFGFTGVMEKLGVERRALTAGENKKFLDPFSPVNPAHKEFAEKMLGDIHEQFITVVRAGRGQRLKETPEIFSGLIWVGSRSIELGLADALGNVESVARDVVKAEDVVDFTPRENIAERVARKFGATLAESLVKATAVGGAQLR